MKRTVTLVAAASIAISAFSALALLFVSNTQAQNGGYRSPLAHSQLRQPRLLRAALIANDGEEDQDDNSAAIVGLWHVKLVSDGISEGVPGGVPKGAPVDAGYLELHSDGTEILNSGGRAPNTTNFCLGVWAKVGPGKYLLNHFGTSWDPTKGPVGPAGPAGELIGPATLHEAVTLAPNRESFAGTFKIDQYDESLHKLVHLQGTIYGTRINVNTPVQSIF